MIVSVLGQDQKVHDGPVARIHVDFYAFKEGDDKHTEKVIKLSTDGGAETTFEKAAARIRLYAKKPKNIITTSEKEVGDKDEDWQTLTRFGNDKIQIEIKDKADDKPVRKVIYVSDKADGDWGKEKYDGNSPAITIQGSFIEPEPEKPEPEKPGQILSLNSDGTVTLPGGGKAKVKNDKLVESVYGNQIVRSDEGGTFEATAPGGRANGIVQGYIILPSGIKGMKDDGSDEGTILLKDNHGPGGDADDGQYKIWFLYKEGGEVKGIKAGREHRHSKPQILEDLKDVNYENKPHLEPGEKLEFKASYQDTEDNGVRLRMDYKDTKTAQWKRLFDHVDYGDKKEGRPYQGNSGVQDGTRVDGRVGGGKPSEKDVKKYKEVCLEEDEENDEKRGKPIRTTKLTSDVKEILSKLATSAIWAREIESDDSDLHDGNDDPLSFGPK